MSHNSTCLPEELRFSGVSPKRVSALLCLLFITTVSAAQSAPVLVQHAGKDAGTTISSSLAFPAANAQGNWIAVVIRAGGTGQVFTVTDTRGNTYRRAIQFNET